MRLLVLKCLQDGIKTADVLDKERPAAHKRLKLIYAEEVLEEGALWALLPVVVNEIFAQI